ncbi:golgi reassembly stacking protein [Stylonychia lemnae]|uniref:Golgi reassembly stacking protein n=1 Tax=Stylonychia lemnae TaxID=5949 RepID=A0A078B189_STYLE|nr:golgi reassembly stacking protein [Stylonychia lemnae]|eukprot:CDW86888.1 golgi reassembly stacking protein [Stylonychia lemnae]
MGNSESQYKPDEYAYRVVAVLQDSPAEHIGIEPQLDFIRYNPQQHDGKLFSEYLAEHEGKELNIFVYNLIQQDNRLEKVRLHKDWGEHNSLLGATIRYESYVEAHNYILAVNDVYLGSAAHEAELQPFKDYILGTREIAFKNLDEFAKYIEVNKGQEIRLHIYNVDQEQVREVPLTPKQWKGYGLLGCDVSFGLLNKIPLRKIDLQRIQSKQGLAGVFGKLTGEDVLQQESPQQVQLNTGKDQGPKSGDLSKQQQNQEKQVQANDTQQQQILNQVENIQINENSENDDNKDELVMKPYESQNLSPRQELQNELTQKDITYQTRVDNVQEINSNIQVLEKEDEARESKGEESSQNQNTKQNLQKTEKQIIESSNDQQIVQQQQRKFNLLPTSLEFD